MFYNFRIAPEAFWLILSSVGVAVLAEIYTFDYAALTDWRAYLAGLLPMLLFRTIPGAILAVVSGGGFQRPGQPARNEPAGSDDL